jgi:hypothetical protein
MTPSFEDDNSTCQLLLRDYCNQLKMTYNALLKN